MYELCIVGGGSIGGLLAYYAYRGGVENIVVYYRSRESVEKISSSGGLTIIYGGREYFVPVKPRHYLEPLDKCRFIVNAVKAYDVPYTIDLMKKIVSRDTLITLIQNGFGSLEYVEKIFTINDVAGGVVFIGATRRDRDVIIHNGGETIFAGCRRGLCSNLYELSNIFRRGGCDFRIVGDIDFYRWIKLAVNAVINPLTGITGLKNRVILTSYGRELACMIIEELVEVAEKYGYRLDPDKLLEIVIRSARNTAENYSSMAQDILSRKKTEIDYINGFIARELGRKHSVNNILVELIHLIEESR